MRIPHLINKSTFDVYRPSKPCLHAESEQNRNIHAEDFEWDKNNVLPLVTISLQVICKNYKKNLIFDALPETDQVHFLEILPTDLPLQIAIVHITADFYWERRFKATFGEIVKSRFHRGLNWKEKYLERYARKLIEEAEPQYDDESFLVEILKLSSRYVKHLTITELQPWTPPLNCLPEEIPDVYPIKHINFQGIFASLSELKEIDMSFCLKKQDKMETFSMKYFKISKADCEMLGKALLQLQYLVILKIRYSPIEDVHVQALTRSLIENETLEEIDFSHCKIGDDGTKCIAKLIMTHPRLRVLNLADNRIGVQGAKALAYALYQDTCCPLVYLNLRLNPLGHEGICAVFSYLIRAGRLHGINLAGCGFDDATAMRLGDLFTLNNTLRKLDISNNYIDESGAGYIEECLKKNETISEMDLRETDIPPKVEVKIMDLIKRNNKHAILDEFLLDSDEFLEDEEIPERLSSIMEQGMSQETEYSTTTTNFTDPSHTSTGTDIVRADSDGHVPASSTTGGEIH